jgi:hypothetical protein
MMQYVITTTVMITDTMCHVRQGHSNQFCTNYDYALREHVIIITVEDVLTYSVNRKFHNSNNKNKLCFISHVLTVLNTNLNSKIN